MHMTSDSMRRLVELAHKNDLNAFDAAWKEAVDACTAPVGEFLEAIGALEAQGHFPKAAQNLNLLVPKYLDRQKYDEVTLVLKRIAQVAPRQQGLRANFLRVFTARHGTNPAFEALVKRSGLDTALDILKAVQQLETYLAFSVGGYVEHRSGWGVGVLTAVDAEQGMIVVDFRDAKGHDLSFDTAHSILKHLPKDGFRAMKFDRMDELRRIAETDEVRLVKLAVLSRERSSTVRDVRDMLTDGIIPAKDWSKWWTRARAKVKRDNNVKLGAGNNPGIEVTVRELSYEETVVTAMNQIDELPAKVKYLRDLIGELEAHPETRPAIMMAAGVLSKTTSEALRGDPGAALSLALVLEKVAQIDDTWVIPDHLKTANLIDDPERIVSLLPAVQVSADRKDLLQRLKALFPAQWIDLCVKAIYLGENDVGDYCLKELIAAGAFDRATTLIFDLLKRFRDHRGAFLWYVRVATGEKLHQALPNPGRVSLLEKTILLHSHIRNRFFQTEDPELRKEFRNIEKMLQNRNYEFVRDTMREASPSEAYAFYTMARTSRSLPDDVKDGMIAAILRTRPEVAKERIEAEEMTAGGEVLIDERIIYVSRAGYMRYENDFNKLVNDDIPANAREIGRAASYGDLSENAEWSAAIEKQGFLTRRAEEMRAALEKARVIDESMITEGVVAVGCCVSLMNQTTNKIETYTVLGPWDADMEKGVISYMAPLGRALLGKKVGAETFIDLPSGKTTYRVESIVQAQIS